MSGFQSVTSAFPRGRQEEVVLCGGRPKTEMKIRYG